MPPPPDPLAPTDDDPVDIDLDALTQAVGMSFAPAAAPPADALAPLADDLHHLMQRVHVLEQGQAEILAKLDAAGRGTAVTLDKMHRELLGDRRVTVDRRVLAALAPADDALHDLRAALPPGDDSPYARQLTALAGVVANALQRLGFTRFEPDAGAPFDPARMEALGTAAGPPGVVLGVVRCGYLYGSGVERTAGVLLARPDAPPPPAEEAP